MKRLWIGIGILMFGLTGCQKEYANETEHLCDLLEKDKPDNQKSVYWDGVEAKLKKDELDNKDILDGRWGEFCKVITDVEGVYSFGYYEECLNNIEIVSETAADYHVIGDGRDIHIEQVDYETEKKGFEENENYKEYNDELIGRRLKNQAKEYKHYIGIEEFDEHLPYAGYVLLVQMDKSGNAYKISVTGEGYTEDILILAKEVMGDFSEWEDGL